MDVEAGATALDATDAVCATGRGVAARTTYRSGTGASARASASLKGMAAEVGSYRTALASLDAARAVATGTVDEALGAVVRDGQAEATALAAFGAAATQVWPQYAALDKLEALWIKRAVTPWYRSDQEGADAYAVLALPFRHFLEVARARLEGAQTALRTPNEVQAATLSKADVALTASQKHS